MKQNQTVYLWTALAALSTPIGANLVWNRINTVMATASPGARRVFNMIKIWLDTQKNVKFLRFDPIDAVSMTTDSSNADGNQIGAGVATVWAVYVKKRTASGDNTDAYIKIFDNGADTDYFGGALADRISLPLSNYDSTALAHSDEAIAFFPEGLDFASGLRAASTTTSQGTTVTVSAASSGDGFILSS